MLSRLRALVKEADPEVVEEWKWRGVPTWYHDGIICTGETYKSVVKMTFAKGASLKDPSGLFNSSLEGNTRRAIDFHEGEKINEKALKALVRAAVTLNKSKARREPTALSLASASQSTNRAGRRRQHADLAETGRSDHDDLETIRPGFVASPRTGRNAHRVPLSELDDFVVELHPSTPAHDDVHLFLLLVRVAVREPVAGRDALVTQAGLLEFQRIGSQAELQLRRAIEIGPNVFQVVLEVSERNGTVYLPCFVCGT